MMQFYICGFDNSLCCVVILSRAVVLCCIIPFYFIYFTALTVTISIFQQSVWDNTSNIVLPETLPSEAVLLLEQPMDGVDEFLEIPFDQRNEFTSKSQHISSLIQGMNFKLI